MNNAGIVIRGASEEYTPAEWQSALDVNLHAAFFCAQAAYPGMSRRGRDKIINVGSLLGTLATPTTAAYAASKAAIMQLTRALAVAWAKDGITVNAVLPGWIDTPMSRSVRDQAPELTERVLARTPAGRWGQPEDLAGVAIFLASPASDFLVGSGILVDGGYGSLG
ncbi:MAG: SDR family oxidoreductase [Acetobacteraceae bacterium]